MTSKSKSFPMFRFIFFIFVVLAAILVVDINKNGSFKASTTGKYAKDIGAYPYIERGINTTKVYYNHSYRWAVKNVPVYYEKTAVVCKPYFKVLSEYALIGYEKVKQSLAVIGAYIVEKVPFISQWIETYAPNLPSKELMLQFYDSLAHYSKIFLNLCLTYIVEAINIIINVVQVSISWLQQNVFVGNLSSDNLQKYAMQGINAASKFAVQTYVWVHDKVLQLYS